MSHFRENHPKLTTAFAVATSLPIEAAGGFCAIASIALGPIGIIAAPLIAIETTRTASEIYDLIKVG